MARRVRRIEEAVSGNGPLDLGLVMGGGGARAAYQVGFLRHVARYFPDLHLPYIHGISAGAINAAGLASHHGTFAQAIGESFASTWDDPNREFAHDEPLAGRSGRRSDAAIPDELRGFHYISVLDPGDDPESGGLDWTSWHVAVDYEDNVPVVVGLTLDQWAP